MKLGLADAGALPRPFLAAGAAVRLGRKLTVLALEPLYRLYEAHLAREVIAGPMPRHIGLILDGNRRHGRAQGLTDYRRIYEIGAHKLDDVLGWCAGLGIGHVTLWVFSTDNLARPVHEVSGIFAAIEAKMRALATDPRLHSLGVRVEVIGRLELLPESLVAALTAAREATAEHTRMTLTVATGYGGREEVTDAVRAYLRSCAGHGLTFAQAADRLTPEAIRNHLYLPALPDPDLIIRTSGEIRLSGFMLWQSAYSEFYFTDVNWPAFRRIDLLRAIRSFQMRDRRLGR